MVRDAISSRDGISEAVAQLAELAQHPGLPDYLKALLPKLQAILDGARDPALAADPALNFADAAELQLLLERL